MSKNWHFYISLNQEAQFDILIDELVFLREKFKEIQVDRSGNVEIELKSEEWNETEGADIFSATIRY